MLLSFCFAYVTAHRLIEVGVLYFGLLFWSAVVNKCFRIKLKHLFEKYYYVLEMKKILSLF